MLPVPFPDGWGDAAEPRSAKAPPSTLPTCSEQKGFPNSPARHWLAWCSAARDSPNAASAGGIQLCRCNRKSIWDVWWTPWNPRHPLSANRHIRPGHKKWPSPPVRPEPIGSQRPAQHLCRKTGGSFRTNVELLTDKSPLAPTIGKMGRPQPRKYGVPVPRQPRNHLFLNSLFYSYTNYSVKISLYLYKRENLIFIFKWQKKTFFCISCSNLWYFCLF